MPARFFVRPARLGIAVVTVVLVAIAIIPISNFATRAAAAIFTPALWLLLIFLTWSKRPARFALVILGLIVAIFLVTPGRAFSTEELRAQFCHDLTTYEGTPYVWGGENHIGIDCSGLVRCGFMSAALKRGIATANPRLVRFAISFWWRDCTARDLGLGYNNLTMPVLLARSINTIDLSAIRPGDLAVTMSGVHVLAYIGNGKWVEADPTAHRVLIVRVPEPGNAWFNVPVRVVRWRIFSA